MEYTICTETLTYYALRNIKGEYYCEKSPTKKRSGLLNCTMLGCLSDAQSIRDQYPEFTEIRKVKIIDIGEV